MLHKTYTVYILANPHRTLYAGVTNDLVRRLVEHRSGGGSSFTKRYGINALVWYETTSDVISAIEREKQIKSWKRRRKIELIDSVNPLWVDLATQIGLPAVV